MKRILLAGLCLAIPALIFCQATVEKWDRFETTLKGPHTRNNFREVTLKATFVHRDTTITVNGFCDGDDVYRIRLMPTRTGRWTYTTTSNRSELNRQKGAFECVAPTGNNHGPVRVRGTHHFCYADGTPYYAFGTTAYAWTHMDQGVEELTLASLADARFNKVRMCVFPKNYNLVKEEPTRYPYVIRKESVNAQGEKAFEWDFDRFDPAFFQHLEQRIDDLRRIGVEADLIIFHPYDKGRWGFDAMPNDVNVRYIEYLTARLASFRNVWWSMANEFDYVKPKTNDDWDMLARTVVANDPYRHLCSIHGSTATYYKYWNPEYTHTSIQDEGPVSDFGRASIVRNIYPKPVVFDEVCYEGNLSSRWGRLSGEEMLHNIWQGLIAGTYVTHGECYMYRDHSDTIFWAKGGEWKGTSWRRIGFTRDIIEALPNPLELADVSRDNYTATAGDGCYIVYLGKQVLDTWTFDLPVQNAGYQRLGELGRKFKVDIIDTWDMTVTPYPVTFETTKALDYRVYDKDARKVRLPLKPYLALRITEAK